ncbi:esterase/lipase family protein [Piscinibacter gummiphilus]|uniref:Uncharacterized protein n=1 Tax=Piscinibacter gummiphilus TaxID=946333 RepID=A0A1W6LF96_9BURK|nr:alpha/beta hydrolase [Piscinibacter gummiphilus]ARN22887.1 hypothetical protein A4W93_24895 [Piscinibacter gummiphilus]ATU67586.1 hypothetical protein CPZ87_25030 [Piscinibacter gummiphilus]GLS96707.1 hypothetical protein GCM10007918_39990 [Piscinibacter gummiphilus]
MSRLLVRLTATTLALALSGCALVRLDRESKAFYASAVLAGRIEAPGCTGAPLIVAAWQARPDGPALAHRTLLHEPGGFELVVPPGRYGLFAFCDRNRNGAPDPGEPSGASAGEPVAVADAGVVVMPDLAVGDGSGESTTAGRAAAAWPAFTGHHSTQAGALADLDAPAFSAENGRRGYWEPMAFFRETGGNLYQLEPYDPKRIPVIFAHGATGSAQDFRGFFDHLDRTRYQAWFFQYPSGASVDSMAYLLYWKVFGLQVKYRFEKVHFVAHSMGGLVVRRFWGRHGQQLAPLTSSFISLSTPWAGETSAETGVKHAPAVVPSWRDMEPGGPFLVSLFDTPLPAGVDHYLLFGYRGSAGLTRPNNDGVVTLASQLRGPAQAEAKLVYGFDEDHVSILSSPRVWALVNTLLANADTAADTAAGAPRPAGRVETTFAFDNPGGPPPGLPWLVLRRPGGGTADTLVIPMSAADSGRPIGPIPAGVYDTSLVVPAFKAEPAVQRLRVRNDRTAALSFRLVPRGELAGYIGADDGAFGMAAGGFRPPSRTVRITSVTLAGAGVSRHVVPREDAATDPADCTVSGTDAAFPAGFCFFDLPAGEYELTIQAKGHRPHVSRHQVTPGRPGPMAPVVMVAE